MNYSGYKASAVRWNVQFLSQVASQFAKRPIVVEFFDEPGTWGEALKLDGVDKIRLSPGVPIAKFEHVFWHECGHWLAHPPTKERNPKGLSAGTIDQAIADASTAQEKIVREAVKPILEHMEAQADELALYLRDAYLSKFRIPLLDLAIIRHASALAW